ncbi:MAG: UDP-galactopyranose mutase [Acetobacteraceae bacterium]
MTALLPTGAAVPLPINRRTLEVVFGRDVPDESAARALLQTMAVDVPNPRNAYGYLLSKIGLELTDLFFARYTKKMWGMTLSEMDASVVKRIPMRFDDEDRYFPDDPFQALPTAGYTELARQALAHDGIRVTLNQPFEKAMQQEYGFCFLSSPIDEYFDYCHGALPYRSIRFHTDTITRADVASKTATVNFTDDRPFTRSTYWHLLPGHDTRGSTQVTRTVEEPCDYKDNQFERYYPVRTADGRYQDRYRLYAEMAAQLPGVMFIGRCGTYRYLDMHQVINQTLTMIEKWHAARVEAV